MCSLSHRACLLEVPVMGPVLTLARQCLAVFFLPVMEPLPYFSLSRLMETYREYSIRLEKIDRQWRSYVSPTRSDLPILGRYCLTHATKSAAETHAKQRIDALFSSHDRER